MLIPLIGSSLGGGILVICIHFLILSNIFQKVYSKYSLLLTPEPVIKILFCIWCSNYRTIAVISHASKVMLKILQARLQQYMNCELPDVQVVLEKAEEPEINLPTSTASSKKQESSRKASISALLTMPKPLTVWITINCGKF